MKGQYVADLKIGDEIRETFILNKKNVRQKRGGGYFATLELSDRTGHIEGIMWDGAEEMNRLVHSGDFVFVTGTIGEYNSRPQVNVQNIKHLSEKEIDPADFLPASQHSVEEMYEELINIGRDVVNPHLKALFDAFFPIKPHTTDAVEFVNNFKRAPGAIRIHHARIGGLLEHTLTTLKIARTLCSIYPEVNAELLLVGTALHDIGKTKEYLYTTRFGASDEGQFYGHLIISYDMVKNQISRIKDFPQNLANKLLHIILSHHGEYEWGSPIKPKLLEALLIHFIDNLDAKAEIFIETFRREGDSESSWSEYHNYLEREIYLRDGE